MRIYDMHIHSFNMKPDPDALIAGMEKAGVYGGCVFSNWPDKFNPTVGTSFDERLNETLDWCRGYEDRLFPVLWVHPYEENIIENVRRAADAGIAAFKIICGDFYVYEEQCLRLLEEIASLDRPVIFHSGILWDGGVSSKFNRPLNWEALLRIKGLRFSMGHCSWPWVDECVALYGKFLNSLLTAGTAEMFFDITPGTPEIYRRDLLTKLYTVGYDVGHNVMFGTDCSAAPYKTEWTEKWLKIDGDIMDELGVSRENRELLYEKNLMRFLGKTKERPELVSPTTDDSHAWSCKAPEVKENAEKWYLKLGFPQKYNKDFYRALDKINVSDNVTVESFGEGTEDGARNLITYLSLCEGVAEKYREAGIPEEILVDTLYDIVRWCESYTAIKGKLYLGEIPWLKRHMTLNLFKLGRLQFAMAPSFCDIPKYGIKNGDPVLEVHIPAGEKLTPEECRRSFEMAEEFFAKYFPDFKYDYITCHSWLLDSELKALLPEDSNILAFARLFDVVDEEESYAALRYVFPWDTDKSNVKDAVTFGSFSEKVKRHVLKGGVFHESMGVIKR